MNYGFIYITENLVTGKRYLGLKTYKGNWKSYLGSGKLLRKAISKYGAKNFKRTIIYEAETPEELDAAERRFITEYNAVEDPGWYNLSPGGLGVSNGFKGKKHSEERNRKLSEKLKGHTVTDKVRKACAKNIRKTHNPISIAKRAATMSGENHPRSIPVTIDGVTYPTISAGVVETGMTYHKVRKLALSQNVR